MKKVSLKISLFTLLILAFCGKSTYAVIGASCVSTDCDVGEVCDHANPAPTCVPEWCDSTMSPCVVANYSCQSNACVYIGGTPPPNPPPGSCQDTLGDYCTNSFPCCTDPATACINIGHDQPGVGTCGDSTVGGLPNISTCNKGDFHLDCSKLAENADDPCASGSILYLYCPIVRGINILLYAVGSVLIILILYGAIKAVTSTGDPKQLEGAKMVWTYALFGFAIIVFSIALVLIILRLFGVTTFNPFTETEQLLEQMLTKFYNNLYTNVHH